MSQALRRTRLPRALLALGLCCFSHLLFAQAVEQRVWVKAVGEGPQCRVITYFKGDTDNCRNDAAHGRADCPAESGCVCTRKDKRVKWSMDGKGSFSIAFDQSHLNPFVQKGESACNFQSNKEGNLRCRVKGKDVADGIYSYTVQVPNCGSVEAQLKIY